MDAHEGLEDCVLNFSVGVGSGGVDCDWAARRRDRNGDDVFLRGSNSKGSSSGSCLRFGAVELTVGLGTGRGLNFGDPPRRQGGWYMGSQTVGSSKILE